MTRSTLLAIVSLVSACGSVASAPDANTGDDGDDVVDIDAAEEGFSLTVTVLGEGSVVSTSVSGINCGVDCSETYAADTVVTLVAAPVVAGTFDGWSGDCTGTGECTVTMSQARAVTASFQCTSGSTTFDFTGGPQTFVRPACVTSITFDVSGAGGGPGFYQTTLGVGGLGGRVRGTLAIAGTDQITVFVGGAGGAAPDGTTGGADGYNGGGHGGNLGVSGQTGGAGGGGSDIRIGGVDLTQRVVVAGGGAGAAVCGGTPFDGAHGGDLVGGTPVTTCSGTANLPSGGTQTAGGVGGSYPGYCNAAAGALGAGAPGCDPSGGGGGGGGYYGGGGGAWNGGGGGSSYASPVATGVTHTQGYRAGNGQVVISW